jgi:hypothetical protein
MIVPFGGLTCICFNIHPKIHFFSRKKATWGGRAAGPPCRGCTPLAPIEGIEGFLDDDVRIMTTGARVIPGALAARRLAMAGGAAPWHDPGGFARHKIIKSNIK